MKIRLYVPVPLAPGSRLEFSDSQAHYLKNVLRCSVSDTVFLFNGKEGEFEASLSEISKKKVSACVGERVREQPQPLDVRLYFAPLKKEATDLVVQKAAELGATFIRPVITEFTQTKRVNAERLTAIAVEAAEQCRRLDVPAVEEPVGLFDMLSSFDQKTLLFHLDEKAAASEEALPRCPAPVSFLVGPEGGFSDQERALIKSYPFARSFSLGENILRAETAAIAALALFQVR